jgi:hypothetical protein
MVFPCAILQVNRSEFETAGVYDPRMLKPMALLALSWPALAAPQGSSPAGAQRHDQTHFEILTSKTPLSELVPVPFSFEDERIRAEVDAEICLAYQRWRAEGNGPRDHMESWCPTRE